MFLGYRSAKKHSRGVELYRHGKYDEAEEILRQAVYGREQTLGKDHKDTLDSKHWLGRTLYDQKKYNKAEEILQQAVYGREQTLGKDHEDTLNSKHWLGVALYKQEKYNEAEEILQQAIYGEEQTLGKDHKDTLYSKHSLGRTLYKLKKDNEAEEVLQQAVYGREQTLGKDHKDTLNSKHWLGLALYKQEKYNEAKEILQQAVHGQEQTLRKDHKHTLDSKKWLGRAQEKYDEAKEVLQQVLREQEQELGNKSMQALPKNLLETLPQVSPPLINNTEQAVRSRISNFFPTAPQPRAPYTDSEIYEISSLLKHVHLRWSRVPRTYIILRTIGHLEVLDEFIDLGFSDYWFPVTERRLPNCLHPSVLAKFVSTQELVLTKSMDLEKGENGQHCFFKRGDPVPLERKEILGSGGFGEVDKVSSLISFKEYARKRVLRSSVFGSQQTEKMKLFLAEIEILKRLKHRHVVKFVGSYTDPKYIGLIMSPVAEMNLATYLLRAGTSKHGELRTFFGCLANALEFLHQKKIRHKDITPGNILVHSGNILFTDFGLSFDFTDATGSTTINMVNGMTPRYCAPEVALHVPRNTSSDVWSLGVVFLDMIAVLKGKSIKYIDEFFNAHGSQQGYVRTNPAAFNELVEELQRIGDPRDSTALSWIQPMLRQEQRSRPTAAEVVALITAGGTSTAFCGICCFSLEDDFSDSVSE